MREKLYHLQNLIVRNKIEMISEENAFVHVSGHPNRDDLKDMYNWVKTTVCNTSSWRTPSYG